MTADKRHVLILAPFKAEAKIIAAILPDCRQSGATSWCFSGGRLVAGNASGRDALLLMLDQELCSINYARIVLFGAAGALTSELEIGQLFNCNRFIHADLELDIPILPALPAASIITVDQPVIAKESRCQLNAAFNASLVDMESYFFAAAMNEKSQNFSVMRFVSDTANIPFALPFPASIGQNIARHRAQIIDVLLS